jgi:hypothetical protein
MTLFLACYYSRWLAKLPTLGLCLLLQPVTGKIGDPCFMWFCFLSVIAASDWQNWRPLIYVILFLVCYCIQWLAKMPTLDLCDYLSCLLLQPVTGKTGDPWFMWFCFLSVNVAGDWQNCRPLIHMILFLVCNCSQGPAKLATLDLCDSVSCLLLQPVTGKTADPWSMYSVSCLLLQPVTGKTADPWFMWFCFLSVIAASDWQNCRPLIYVILLVKATFLKHRET